MAPSTVRVTLDGEITLRAKESYLSDCAQCHGEGGKGVKRERAPPLTFQLDWYLRKQMENFRNGKRQHGREPIAAEPSAELAVELVAWLASLPNSGM